MRKSRFSVIVQAAALSVVLCAVSLLSMTTASALTSPGLFVSPSARATGADSSCTTARYTVINQAIAAASSGEKVTICAGVYKQAIALNKAVHLVGVGATLDATHQTVGVVISSSGASVVNLTIDNAIGEGITADSTPGKQLAGVVIASDVFTNDDAGTALKDHGNYARCESGSGLLAGTCGGAIHLDGVVDSTIEANVMTKDDAGIELIDSAGPAHNNTIQGNLVTSCERGAGIALVSVNSKAFKSAPESSFGGVYGNELIDNDSIADGIKVRGAGVLLATDTSGGAVYNNTLVGNRLIGNGIGGVTIEALAKKDDLNGNSLSTNTFLQGNNTLGYKLSNHHDKKTTGLIVATTGMSVKVTLSKNTFERLSLGVWTTGHVTLAGATTSSYVTVDQKLATG